MKTAARHRKKLTLPPILRKHTHIASGDEAHGDPSDLLLPCLALYRLGVVSLCVSPCALLRHAAGAAIVLLPGWAAAGAPLIPST